MGHAESTRNAIPPVCMLDCSAQEGRKPGGVDLDLHQHLHTCQWCQWLGLLWVWDEANGQACSEVGTMPMTVFALRIGWSQWLRACYGGGANGCARSGDGMVPMTGLALRMGQCQ